VLKLTNGKALIWFDMEGLNNRDRPDLSMALAIIAQITQCLIFVDRSLNDTLRSSLCRLIGARMVVIEGREVTWPTLKVILNQSRTPVSPEILTDAFAPAIDFPESDSQVVRLVVASSLVSSSPSSHLLR
jgi:hypothetical protein